MLKDKDLSEIQTLINMGKQRGYVTYEEMNSVLPTHLVSPGEIDDVMIMFSAMDIDVVNRAKKPGVAEPLPVKRKQRLLRRRRRPSPTTRSACTSERWVLFRFSPARERSRLPSVLKSASTSSNEHF